VDLQVTRAVAFAFETAWRAVPVLLLAGCASVLPPSTRVDVESPSTVSAPPPSRTHPATARELAIHAMTYVGTPYRAGGTSPEMGFDCSGLVQYVYGRGAGIALPRTTQEMSRIGTAVDEADLQPGDLVFFNTLRRPYSHVGIYLGDHRFVHAPTARGSVEIADMRRRYWQSRFDGARRLGI
jgi:cell wall-associated NlpC family hydrolase